MIATEIKAAARHRVTLGCTSGYTYPCTRAWDLKTRTALVWLGTSTDPKCINDLAWNIRAVLRVRWFSGTLVKLTRVNISARVEPGLNVFTTSRLTRGWDTHPTLRDNLRSAV